MAFATEGDGKMEKCLNQKCIEEYDEMEDNHCGTYNEIEDCEFCIIKAQKEPVADVLCNVGLDAHAIKAQLDSLLNKVNAVTCPYRHGQKVTDRVLTELSNRQLDVEEALREMGI
jgi:hypothetical protein